MSCAPAPTRAELLAIIRAAAEYFHVTETQIIGTNRTPRPTRARRAAMAIVRERYGLSFPEIGRLFKRDHSSVIVAIDKSREDSEITDTVRDAIFAAAQVPPKPCCPTCGQRVDREALVAELRAELTQLSARLDNLAKG